MPRCRCQDNCSCVFEGEGCLTIEGTGTPDNPYRVNMDACSLPDSELDYAESTIQQLTIGGTPTDITGLIIEFDVDERPVWVEGWLPMVSSAGAANFAAVWITDEVGVLKGATGPLITAGAFFPVRVFERLTVPGHYIRKVQISRVGGGTVGNNTGDDWYVSALAAIIR